MDAIGKMHEYILDKNDTDTEEIKLDIALSNTTSNLAKAYISSAALQYKIENAENKNKEVLKEI